MQPNDTAAAKRTFPDFLSECPQFVYALQLVSNANGQPTYLLYLKINIDLIFLYNCFFDERKDLLNHTRIWHLKPSTQEKHKIHELLGFMSLSRELFYFYFILILFCSILPIIWSVGLLSGVKCV